MVEIPPQTVGTRITGERLLGEESIDETLFFIGGILKTMAGSMLIEGIFRNSDTFRPGDCEPKDYIVDANLPVEVLWSAAF